MTNMTVARTLLLLVVCFVAVQAERKFINLLPSVAPGAQAIGHENGVNGGGKLNQFGKDFYRLGGEDKGWNVDICKLDSDKDGATNGQELGDPDCTWKVGQPKRTFKSHPGDKNSVPRRK